MSLDSITDWTTWQATDYDAPLLHLDHLRPDYLTWYDAIGLSRSTITSLHSRYIATLTLQKTVICSEPVIDDVLIQLPCILILEPYQPNASYAVAVDNVSSLPAPFPGPNTAAEIDIVLPASPANTQHTIRIDIIIDFDPDISYGFELIFWRPVLCPAGDEDNDGLLDCWEQVNPATAEPRGVPYLGDQDHAVHFYPLPGADPSTPDIYVEVDGPTDLDTSMPTVVRVFRKHGLELHISNAPDSEYLANPPVVGNTRLSMCSAKSQFFGSVDERNADNSESLLAAKSKSHRYCVFPQGGAPDNAFGRANMLGNVMVVYHQLIAGVVSYAAGSSTAWITTKDRQIQTVFMHELGHTLGLGHSGPYSVLGREFYNSPLLNCSPNYYSLMNILWAAANVGNFSYLTGAEAYWNSFRLDYSEEPFASINEWSVPDSYSIVSPGGTVSGGGAFPRLPASGFSVPFGPRVDQPSSPGRIVRFDQQMDWGEEQNAVAVNANYFNLPQCLDNSLTQLRSYADWSNLHQPLTDRNPASNPNWWVSCLPNAEVELARKDSEVEDEYGASDYLALAAWRPDCDGDGTTDIDEVVAGAADANHNGVPDVCESMPYVVLAESYDSLPITSLSIEKQPWLNGWTPELSAGMGETAIQDSLSVAYGALVIQAPWASEPGQAIRVARPLQVQDVGATATVSVSGDFNCSTSNQLALNGFDGGVWLVGGMGNQDRITGMQIGAGNGVERNVTGLCVRLEQFNEGEMRNDPIPLVVGQGLTWDAWHHATLEIDQAADRYVRLSVDGDTQDLSAFRLPRTIDGEVATRGNRIDAINLSLTPTEWPDPLTRTDDWIYWDNLLVTIGRAPGATDVPGPEESLPMFLAQPNPFNPRTLVRYALPWASHVSLKVYDQRGRLVRNLVSEVQAAGPMSAEWDGRDDEGRQLSSGVYFLKLATDQGVRTGKVVLLK